MTSPSSLILRLTLGLSPLLCANAGTYTQDFSALPADGSVMAGTVPGITGVVGGQLQLTQAGTQNHRAAFRLPDIDNGGEIREFTLSYDVTITGTTTNPADGYAVTFGNIPSSAASLTSATDNLGEDGILAANNLVFCFDLFNNGSFEAPAIDIRANNSLVRSFFNSPVMPGGSWSISQAGGYPADGVKRQVNIHWEEATGLDITLVGRTGVLATVVNDQPVANFLPSAGNALAFTARTSANSVTIAIDNISLTTLANPPLETGGPVLTELLVDNRAHGEDEDCEKGAWVEVYNGANSSANLTGWKLTDTPTLPGKFPLPAGLTLAPYGYLRIWVDGKNRLTNPIHTNFAARKLGGYVGLYRPDNSLASAFNYVGQAANISYGRLGPEQTLGYFSAPTPALKNKGPQTLDPPLTEELEFDRPGGLFSTNFTLQLLPKQTTNAEVRYTTDNTAPTASSPLWPAAGVNIQSSANIRVRLFKAGQLPGPVSSRSFTKLDTSLTNYRGSGQPFSSNLPIIVFNSYGLDVDGQGGTSGLRAYRNTYGLVIAPAAADGNRAVITAAPQMQNRGGVHLRGETSAGFPQRPYAWEIWDNEESDKKVNILDFAEESDFILISNYNDKSVVRNMMPFEMMRRINGPGRAMQERYVEVFYKQDSATNSLTYNDYRGVYILTEKIKRDKNRVDIAKLAACDNVLTGVAAVDDLAPISGGYIFRKDKASPEPAFTTAGGQGLQIVEPNTVTTNQINYIKGYMDRFEAALNGSSFTDPVNGYAKFINVDTFIDGHLWVEIFKQVDGYRLSTYFTKDRAGKVKYEPLWDYNLCMGNGSAAGGYPADFELPNNWYYIAQGTNEYPYHGRLFQDPAFRRKYWDRYWQLRRGPFSNANVIATIDGYVAQLNAGVLNPVTTSSAANVINPIGRHHARWQRLGQYDWPNATGTALRTAWDSALDPASVTGSTSPFTQVSEIAFVKTWLLRRLMWMDSMSNQYGTNSTTGALLPPTLNQYGGNVPSGFLVNVSDPNASTTNTLYYTTDGSDPVTSTTPQAANTSLTLTQSTWLKLRLRTTGGAWSPLTEANFIVNAVPASAANLVIAEVLFKPTAPSQQERAAGYTDSNDFEYIELLNISTSTVDLTNCRFTGALAFSWTDASPLRQTLASGARMVVVENLAAFTARYGSKGAVVAGAFTGNLSNSSETITLQSASGSIIKQFTYQDTAPWPVEADLNYSLVLINPRTNPDHSNGLNWRASVEVNGCPGLADGALFTGDPLTDSNGDGLSDFAEFILGPNPSRRLPLLESIDYDNGQNVEPHFSYTFTYATATDGVVIYPETTTDLLQWTDARPSMTRISRVSNFNGTTSETWIQTLPAAQMPTRFYWRLKATRLY